MIQGTAYKFGDNVNSDIIIPGRYLIHIDAPTLGGYAFEPLGKEMQERINQVLPPKPLGRPRNSGSPP